MKQPVPGEGSPEERGSPGQPWAYLISAARPWGARGAGAALCPTTWGCRPPAPALSDFWPLRRSRPAPGRSVRWQRGREVTWRWLCTLLLLLPPHGALGQRWGSAGSSRWPCSLFSAAPSATLKTSSLRSLLPDDVFAGQMNKLIALSPQSKEPCACPGTLLGTGTAAGGEVASLLQEGDSSSTCFNHAPGEIRSPQRKPHAHSL